MSLGLTTVIFGYVHITRPFCSWFTAFIIVIPTTKWLADITLSLYWYISRLAIDMVLMKLRNHWWTLGITKGLLCLQICLSWCVGWKGLVVSFQMSQTTTFYLKNWPRYGLLHSSILFQLPMYNTCVCVILSVFSGSLPQHKDNFTILSQVPVKFQEHGLINYSWTSGIPET